MELTIFVPDEAKLSLEERAHEFGCANITEYVERLVTTDLLAAKSFDEILAPIRTTFYLSNINEDEIDTLFQEAREEVYQKHSSE